MKIISQSKVMKAKEAQPDNSAPNRLQAPPHLKVNVTLEEITESEQRNSSHCMVADAVRKTCYKRGIMPHQIAVDIQTIRFTNRKRGFRYVYLTPRIAQKAIINFDQGVHTDPFSFILRGGQLVKVRHNTEKERQNNIRYKAAKRAAEIRTTKESNSKPTIHGGKAPPVGALSHRREYGLHSLRA